jgi:hypothetical protein
MCASGTIKGDTLYNWEAASIALSELVYNVFISVVMLLSDFKTDSTYAAEVPYTAFILRSSIYYIISIIVYYWYDSEPVFRRTRASFTFNIFLVDAITKGDLPTSATPSFNIFESTLTTNYPFI